MHTHTHIQTCILNIKKLLLQRNDTQWIIRYSMDNQLKLLAECA